MTIDTLTLRSPDALVASLPFLLGFTPRDSVVVAWLARGALVLTQRLDWPDRDPHGAWLGALLAPRATTRADEVVVVLVGDGGPAGSPAPDVLGAAVQQACEAAGLPLRDLLQSRGDTWRSLLCRDPGCCPAQGRLVDASVRLAVAAEFTAAGHAPLADRADVVASLQPDAGTRARLAPRVAAAQPRPGDREAWRDEAIAAIADAVSGTTAESEDASAVAIAALGDVRVRDTVLWDVTTGTPAMRVRARGILLEALRASPPETVAPVATAFAVVSWLLGDGARAAMAVECALDADGTYSLALLLRHGLEAGLPPQHWAEAMAGLTREECRHGR